jgi:hypothetical protein
VANWQNTGGYTTCEEAKDWARKPTYAGEPAPHSVSCPYGRINDTALYVKVARFMGGTSGGVHKVLVNWDMPHGPYPSRHVHIESYHQ